MIDQFYTYFFVSGKLILRRVQVAVPGRDDHVADFYAFTESLPAASILEWTEWVEGWEKDPDRPNPFVTTTKSKSVFFNNGEYSVLMRISRGYSAWRSPGTR